MHKKVNVRIFVALYLRIAATYGGVIQVEFLNWIHIKRFLIFEDF